MKIEKLTENKIRIIIKQEDMESNNIDLHKFVLKSIESQSLFLKILNQAKEELDFNVDGYKLLIETFSSSDDIFIFTITKYIDSDFRNFQNTSDKKNLKIRKKIINNDLKMKIINFNNFDDLYDFCNMLFNNKINIKDFCKKNSLYLYNNVYYLILENIDLTQINFKKFNSYISEFSTYKSYSKNFEYKLKEHGKLIINKNAVNKIFNIFT